MSVDLMAKLKAYRNHLQRAHYSIDLALKSDGLGAINAKGSKHEEILSSINGVLIDMVKIMDGVNKDMGL